jgi:arabinan endo-1,5-alpha-L-arabinosidase
MLAGTPAGSAQPVSKESPVAPTYQNPVSDVRPASLPDPSVVRGRDGYWYAYTTSRNITIQRSKDLVTWEPVGTVFTDTTRPSWFRSTTGIWAPDISWLEGRYVLTFSAIDAAVAPNPNRSIGVASAPTPTGPWRADDAPIIPPGTWQPFPDEPPRMQGIIDSELLTAPDGRRYLYYGGFNGGVFVQEVDRQVRQRVGAPVQVAVEDNFEAPFVVYRGGWYWMFLSTGNCCSGPNSGYTVVVARSKSPRGPFVDRTGARADAAYPGGTPVLTPNGNVWVGTAHSTNATDPAGQDWLLYHAIDRHRPWVDMEEQRPLVRSMSADRLDWIDGWPVVRAGLFASEGPTSGPAPARVADPFEGVTSPDPSVWLPAAGWTVRQEEAGGYLHGDPPGGLDVLSLRAVARTGRDLRARASVRTPEGSGTVGMMVGEQGTGKGVRVLLDATRRALVVTDTGHGSGTGTASRARELGRVDLPAALDPTGWHELELRLHRKRLVAELSEAGLYDPQARVEIDLRRPLRSGSLRLLASGAPVDIDDVTVADLHEPVTRRVADPSRGRLLRDHSEEFDRPLGPEWEWVRDPAATVASGMLRFPVQTGDLTGTSNSASVLLRRPPHGDWMVETKLTLDFGSALDKRFPQAGLVVLRGDDDFLRLAVRGHGRARTVEYGKETPRARGPNFGSVLSSAAGGTTTWLRIAHRTDPTTGEGRYRAAISRDGRTWVWAATYTMSAAAEAAGPRIGLVAHGSDAADLVAEFDYVRLYR